MTTMNSKMLVAAVTTATLAMGATTAKADHYRRSCGVGYASYAPRYYAPSYYAPAYYPPPVVYPAPAYGYAPYRPVAYVAPPVYYPAPQYYAPAPVYRPYYAPTSFGFGFGYSRGGHGGHGGYRGHGGHGGHVSHYGGGASFRVGR